MEYTKGDWIARIERHADGRIYSIEIIPPSNSGHGYKPICKLYHQFTTALADAQLISAAPDLYEACKMALVDIVGLVKEMKWDNESEELEIATRHLKKALAKAEGRDDT